MILVHLKKNWTHINYIKQITFNKFISLFLKNAHNSIHNEICKWNQNVCPSHQF
jgi:hypothetical protein